jgi:hypothetical protein
MDTVETMDQGEHQVNGNTEQQETEASNSFVRLLIVAGQTYSAEQSRYVLNLINSSKFLLKICHKIPHKTKHKIKLEPNLIFEYFSFLGLF